jgi:acetyl esterase/lipase
MVSGDHIRKENHGMSRWKLTKRVLGITSLMVMSVSAGQAGGQEAGQANAANPEIYAVPDGVRLIRNLEYQRIGDKPSLLDLYLPGLRHSSLPLIIWIHGGGWRAGSKERTPAAVMASHGYAVASINYRLSGEAVFPAQIQDCKAAVRWLRANAVNYGLDPARFGAWGTSAGGHLAALLGTTGEVEPWGSSDNLRVSSRVQAVCDFFGPTDFLRLNAPGNRIQHEEADSPASRLLGAPIRQIPDKVAEANPITYVSPKTPPFLIVHGDSDRTVPLSQSELLYRALEKTGVEVTLHVVKGGDHGHGLLNYSGLRERVEAFFDRHLKGERPVIPAPIASRVDHYVFKETPQGKLTIQVHLPSGWTPHDSRPAIVFFYGGAWKVGSLNQFLDQAQYFSLRGLVAVRAEYRIESRHGTSPEKCVEDGKSAFRWLRQNASELGIDPERIIGAGGSAGGHVAIAAFTTTGIEAPGEDQSFSPRPDLLVLFNPVFDATLPTRVERLQSKELARQISPLYNLSQDVPAVVMFYGTEDRILQEARSFMARAKELGLRAHLYVAEGQGHGFFNQSPWKERTLYLSDQFLQREHYLKGPAALQPPGGVVMREVAP